MTNSYDLDDIRDPKVHDEHCRKQTDEKLLADYYRRLDEDRPVWQMKREMCQRGLLK